MQAPDDTFMKLKAGLNSFFEKLATPVESWDSVVARIGIYPIHDENEAKFKGNRLHKDLTEWSTITDNVLASFDR